MKQYSGVFATIMLSLGLFGAANTIAGIERPSAQKPLVVTSIKPLEYIVSDLAGELVELHTVLSSAGSPHHYALKSSQVRKINQADLLVWVDPQFEYFLAKLASRKSARDVFQFTAERKAGVQTIDLVHTSAESTVKSGLIDVHDVHGGHQDLHVWLDPSYVVEMIKPLSQRLIALLPQHREILQENERLLLQRLSETSMELRGMFASREQRGFIVFHDAYRHFEAAFGLAHLSSVTEVPDEQIGAKTLARIKKDVLNSHCLIADVSEYSAAQKMANNLGTRLVAVDMLGAEPIFKSRSDESSYTSYLKRFSGQFLECFVG